MLYFGPSLAPRVKGFAGPTQIRERREGEEALQWRLGEKRDGVGNPVGFMVEERRKEGMMLAWRHKWNLLDPGLLSSQAAPSPPTPLDPPLSTTRLFFSHGTKGGRREKERSWPGGCIACDSLAYLHACRYRYNGKMLSFFARQPIGIAQWT